MSPDLYELAWSEFFKTASDESLGERESARERSPGLLPAFPSVSWDRFRHGPDTGDQDDEPEPEAEPDLGDIEGRLARLASYAEQAFGDEAGDE